MSIQVLSVVPAAGEITRDTPLQFDVQTTAVDPFVRVIVGVFFPGSGVFEFAYAQNPVQGGPFEKFYAPDSTVVEVTDPGFVRYRFSLLRQADGVPVWPDSPRLRIYGFNAAGEEISEGP